MFWNIPEPKPKAPPRTGTHWKRKGERLTWELVEISENGVILTGPGNCKGRMSLSRDELEKQFVRA
jgi:hypothetical protein